MWNSSAAADTFTRTTESRSSDDEEALWLAALQRSPTFVRARTSVFRNLSGGFSLIDVAKLRDQEQKQVLDKLVNTINEDSELYFKKVRRRFDA
mgnify:CR=1 FL=1